MTEPDYRLYTFTISHFSEKIRWTLDHLQLPYREICLTPVFHIGLALKMSDRKQTTVPILATPTAAIQDSARILDWLNTHHGPLDLIPVAMQDEISAVETRFNRIGRDVARFMYASSFGEGDDYIIRLWTTHASKAQALAIRHGFPLVKWSLKKKFKINDGSVARARLRISDEMQWLEKRLEEGRTYLVGDRFTAADVTAASLLAPLACPEEHPVYSEAEFIKVMSEAIDPWRDRVALQWVREIYKQHRGHINLY